MTDFSLWQAAKGELENTLALLSKDPPADLIARRHQMAVYANRLQKAARVLVGWEEA